MHCSESTIQAQNSIDVATAGYRCYDEAHDGGLHWLRCNVCSGLSDVKHSHDQL
jgi:hypothetical protein